MFTSSRGGSLFRAETSLENKLIVIDGEKRKNKNKGKSAVTWARKGRKLTGEDGLGARF